jgi:hypothetical protein
MLACFRAPWASLFKKVAAMDVSGVQDCKPCGAGISFPAELSLKGYDSSSSNPEI